MRVALSRPCPGGPFSRFQAAPLRTPAAICQDCGLPPIARPVAPGPPLCPCFCCKVTAIFFKCKKNFKKYLISLIIKHLQRGVFAVKRFNSRVTGFGVLRWLTCARRHAGTQARTTTGYLLKRFVSGSRHPGSIFVLRGMQEAKIKRFNRLCYVYIMLSCM